MDSWRCWRFFYSSSACVRRLSCWDFDEQRRTTRLVLGLLILGLLGATPAEAQRFSCGGHRIHWVGGAPAASAAPSGPDRVSLSS